MIYKGVEWDPRQNAKWPQNENKINIIIQITSITILQAYSSVNIYIYIIYKSNRSTFFALF